MSLSDQLAMHNETKNVSVSLSLSLSLAEKSFAKSLNFSNNWWLGQCSQSDVSSVPVEIFDYLLHLAGQATASLELRDCSCLRFKYLQNALINSVVES